MRILFVLFRFSRARLNARIYCFPVSCGLVGRMDRKLCSACKRRFIHESSKLWIEVQRLSAFPDLKNSICKLFSLASVHISCKSDATTARPHVAAWYSTLDEPVDAVYGKTTICDSRKRFMTCSSGICPNHRMPSIPLKRVFNSRV